MCINSIYWSKLQQCLMYELFLSIINFKIITIKLNCLECCWRNFHFNFLYCAHIKMCLSLYDLYKIKVREENWTLAITWNDKVAAFFSLCILKIRREKIVCSQIVPRKPTQFEACVIFIANMKWYRIQNHAIDSLRPEYANLS